MTLPHPHRTTIVAFSLLLMLALSGCDMGSGESSDEKHVLRVYDVSHMETEYLEGRLYRLLSGDHPALRGRVQLLDETQLAVNGSIHLQEEIASLLASLGQPAFTEEDSLEREYRLQFWRLGLSPQQNDQKLPAGLEPVSDAVSAHFPDHGTQVHDFVETFGSTSGTNLLFESGVGTMVHIRSLKLQPAGAHLIAEISAPSPPNVVGDFVSFTINRNLKAGQPLILGRLQGGRENDLPVYEVLVARMDWND
ncbi:MAG: hypothetical protein V2J42_02590 [Wenzhouxiangella sp.]|nr:hypothetical protein [Wenzhouxiangella sp.]